MANPDCNPDQEIKDLAVQLMDKYPEHFPTFDPDMVIFLKTESKSKPKWDGRVMACKYQFRIGNPHLYAIEIDSLWWEEFTPEQRQFCMYHQMCHIPSGGFDPESKEYAKVLPHSIQDFPEVLGAAGAAFDWRRPGEQLPDLISANEDVTFEEDEPSLDDDDTSVENV